uniref:Uncharacterized protein n=1 Tax=Siphoviridae sp. cthL03 TaxID=2825615 RepID=A0A8S5PG29_9CAUD|nr:MAG TPA: hypothetical protein [Siphoviridae sp. cthL03]
MYSYTSLFVGVRNINRIVSSSMRQLSDTR